jgi:hypothetical protein
MSTRRQQKNAAIGFNPHFVCSCGDISWLFTPLQQIRYFKKKIIHLFIESR